MASAGKGSTRERLLDAAIVLFASKGYAATSVPDIQRACGLSAGSGAMYRHFSSKRELLTAAVRRYLDRISDDGKRFDAEPTRSVEQALGRVATLVWDGINDNAMLLRVIFRESEAFPELVDELWSGVTARTYQRFARFARQLRVAGDAGVSQIADPEASAAVLMAALAHYPVVRLLIGRTPGGIAEDRYREAWIQNTLAVLRQAAVPPPGDQ